MVDNREQEEHSNVFLAPATGVPSATHRYPRQGEYVLCEACVAIKEQHRRIHILYKQDNALGVGPGAYKARGG